MSSYSPAAFACGIVMSLLCGELATRGAPQPAPRLGVCAREGETLMGQKPVRISRSLDATTDAIRQWEFEPLLVQGKAMPACMSVTVNINWR